MPKKLLGRGLIVGRLGYSKQKVFYGRPQPVHPCSLISAFVVCSLDIIIPVVSMYDISSLQLTPETEQACLSLTWVENPAYRFSRDMAHILTHHAFDNQLNSHDVISRQSNDAIAM